MDLANREYPKEIKRPGFIFGLVDKPPTVKTFLSFQ